MTTHRVTWFGRDVEVPEYLEAPPEHRGLSIESEHNFRDDFVTGKETEFYRYSAWYCGVETDEFYETPQEAVDALAAAFIALDDELAARKPDAPICAPSTMPDWVKRQASRGGRVAFGDTDEEALAALAEGGQWWAEQMALDAENMRDE